MIDQKLTRLKFYKFHCSRSSDEKDKHCQPKDHLYSRKFNEDRKVQGYMLRKITVYSELHCVDSCFQSHYCDAYNLSSLPDGTLDCTLIKELPQDVKLPKETKAEGFVFNREGFRKVGATARKQFLLHNSISKLHAFFLIRTS